jgi:hypothetical protein
MEPARSVRNAAFLLAVLALDARMGILRGPP